MQKFFQIIGILIFIFSCFLLMSRIKPDIFPFNLEGVNNWAGGIGGLLFGVLTFIVGGSEKATEEVARSVKNIVTQIGLVNTSTINIGDDEEILKRKGKKK